MNEISIKMLNIQNVLARLSVISALFLNLTLMHYYTMNEETLCVVKYVIFKRNLSVSLKRRLF